MSDELPVPGGFPALAAFQRLLDVPFMFRLGVVWGRLQGLGEWGSGMGKMGEKKVLKSMDMSEIIANFAG